MSSSSSIPPIEDSILTSNPKFAALHTTLTTRLLNPNGSTKNHPTQVEMDARAEDLKAHRLRFAKRSLLVHALTSLPLQPTGPTDHHQLPPELTELIILLTLQLSASKPLDQESYTLLQNTELYAHILPESLPTIGELLSNQLHKQAKGLLHLLTTTPSPSSSSTTTQIPNPNLSSSSTSSNPRIPKTTTSSSKQRRPQPPLSTLPTHLTHLLTTNSQKRLTLNTSLASLTPLTVSLLTTHWHAATHIIHLLEQTLHGAQARSSRATAGLLAAQAQETALKLKQQLITAQGLVYTPETLHALGEYVRHLKGERGRLRERKRVAEGELRGWGVGREDEEGKIKEKVMREIARVYGEMLSEIGEVRREVERLEGDGGKGKGKGAVKNA